MIQRPRIPAIATLLLVLAAGILFLMSLRKDASAADAQLAALQQAITQPDAPAEAWIRYADKLFALGQHARAAVAYKRVLEGDPYNKQVRLQCAMSLAALGKPDDFFTFLKATLLVDPRLTLNIMGRPEVSSYLAEARFQALQKEAVAQSLD